MPELHKTAKTRMSNFELLRIIAMMLVMLVHACFVSVGDVSHAAVIQPSMAPKFSFLYILESIALVCVNLFVLISGYFGLRPSTKSIGNLVFQLLFWGLVCGGFYIWIERIEVLVFLRYLVSGAGYSFVPCYFMLMLVAPILNSFIDACQPEKLKRYVILYFVLQTVFGFFLKNAWPFGSGSSLPLFIGLYLLGRYVRLYLPSKNSFGKYFSLFLIIGLLRGLAYFCCVYFLENATLEEDIRSCFTSYTSPLTIIESLLLLLAFRRWKFTSPSVNYLAQSAFVVYLVHMYPVGVVYYTSYFRFIFSQLPLLVWIPLLLFSIIFLYFVIALFDQIRIFLWKLLLKFY